MSGRSKRTLNGDMSKDAVDKENNGQEPPKRPRIEAPPRVINEIERCGKINFIHLENFMCHGNLRIELGAVTNFLVGCNGSGKSAILTALVVGLGSSARATSRSTNIAKFIKIGETSAKVEIQLNNNAMRAYKPEIFGESITITRVIRQYSSAYTIKDGRGNVVSRKVEDLRNLLLAFNIRVENPVFVLNQESAREFLKDLEPKKNYQMFLKASQLDIVLQSLSECMEMFNQQEAQLVNINETMESVQKVIDDNNEKLHIARTFMELKVLLSQFELQLNWAVVAGFEKKVAEINSNVSDMATQESELKSIMDNRGIMETELTSELRDYDENIRNLVTKLQEANNVRQNIKATIEEIADREHSLEEDIRNEKKHMAFMEQNKLEVETHMATYQQTKGETEKLKKEHARKIRELLEKIPKSEQEVAEEEIALRELQQESMQHAEQRKQANEKRSNIVRAINGKRGEIAALNADKRNALSIFGRDAIQLDQDIQRAYERRQFKQMPKGPLGRYIKVPNPKSRDIVENQLGGTIRAYVVGSHEDCRVLNNLLKHYPNYRPTIITTKYMDHVYDVSRNAVRAPQGTYLLMDQINCSEPVVMNLIIDQLRVESILLTECKRTAEQISSQENLVPHGLSKVLVVYPNKFMEYIVAPNYAMYASDLRSAKCIQVNVDDRITQLEHDIAQFEEQLPLLNKELQTMSATETKLNEKLLEKKKAIKDLTKSIQTWKAKLYELEHYEYQEHQGLDELERDCEDITKDIEQMRIKIDGLQDSLEKTKEEKANEEKTLENNRIKTNELNQLKTNIEGRRQALQTKIRNIDQTVSTAAQNLATLKIKIQAELNKRVETENSLHEATTKALELGKRVDTEYSEEQLKKCINQCKVKIQKGSSRIVNVEEVTQLIADKTNELQEIKDEYDDLNKTVQRLKVSLNKRIKLVKRIRDTLILTANHYFESILHVRKFSGRIEVNNIEQTMTVCVTPPKFNSQNGIQSTRGLSGGERSFTTVALLKALWAISDHPFYFLDEYDVFTDELNRQVITDALISEGTRNPHRQYCFLTPQDTKVEHKENVKIHRLSEPRRQTAHS